MKRGLKEEWRGYIRREYSMAGCQSLASDVELFLDGVRGTLKEGQLFCRAVKSNWKTDEMRSEKNNES